MAGYDAEHLRKDILAGVIVGIVALPLAMAFAIASGVSPERGLYTAIVAGAAISIFGGSRVQIGGPTGAMVAILGHRHSIRPEQPAPRRARRGLHAARDGIPARRRADSI